MFIPGEHRIETSTAPRAETAAIKPIGRESAAAPKYNSLDIVYRPEFRQVVLLDRDPATGDVLGQIPSEYQLQLYARSEGKTSAPAGGISNGEGKDFARPIARAIKHEVDLKS